MQTETERRADYWWIVLVQGIAVIILSLILLAQPLGTTVILTLFFGIYLFIFGFVELFHALFGRNTHNRLWMSVKGFISFLVGVFLLAQPLFFTTSLPAYLLYLIAFVLIFIGAISIFGKPQGDDHRHISTIILGILEILLGLAILTVPIMYSLPALIFGAGILGVAMGVTMIVDSFRLRKLKNA